MEVQKKYKSNLSSSYPDAMRADPVFNFEFQGGHVISRNSQGETVSTYGDLIWDFYPYRGPNRTRYNKINFQLVRPDFVSELKYLMGIIIYGKCSRNVDHLKAATIQGHFATLKKVAKFAGSKQLKVADVFCDTQVLVEFLRTNLGANDINSLTSIYKSLSRIENLAFGFSEIEHKSREVLTLAFKETKKNNQTPVIPERLLSNLISELGILFSNVSDYEDRLHAFIDKSLEDKCYAKHLTVQRRLGLCMSSFRPNFLQATREHGLEEFFENYNVKSLRQLSKLISSIQHAVQIYICIYSGMRRSEIKALKIDALVRRSGTRAVLIQGICSKPKPFSTYWISSSEIIRPYEIATRLALRIGAEDEDVAEENMLFPSSLHLGFTSSLPKTTNYRLTLDSVRCTHEIYGYLDQSRLTTNSQDYKFLEKIDPFRDWSEDGRYQIDRPWRFAYHQFRRSLAYCASQSGLVSLQSLQRQLKHLCAEMTVYYCQSLGDNGVPETYHNEFHQFLFKVKPDADLTAYVEKIMETKEIIAGAESVREELNRNVSSPPTVAERKHLRREFKLGRVSYSETPLGACLTRRKCTKRSVMQLTACIGCDSSVTIMSKLDQAIISQTKFLENAPRNDKDDFIYRSENNELQGLRKLKRRLMRENKDGL